MSNLLGLDDGGIFFGLEALFTVSVHPTDPNFLLTGSLSGMDVWLLQAVGCCTNCPVPNQTTAQPKYKAANYDVMICWGVHLKGLIQQMTGYFERGRGVVTTSSGVVHGLKKGCQKPDCHHTATFTCLNGTVHSNGPDSRLIWAD